MARKDNNLDVSTVSFKAEILFNGEKYDEPLYKIVDQASYKAILERRFGKRIYQRSNRPDISIEAIRTKYFLERRSEYTYFRDNIVSPLRYETELGRALCLQSEINAMRSLYYACLDCGTGDRPKIEQIFQLLFLSTHYYSKCKANMESAWSYYPSRFLENSTVRRIKKHQVEKYLSDLSDLYPLCTIYNDFVQKEKEVLRQYEHRFNAKFNTNTKKDTLPEEESSKRPISIIRRFSQNYVICFGTTVALFQLLKSKTSSFKEKLKSSPN